MNNGYEDIISLPHYVSPTRLQMSMADRAAQFSPFAALTGFDGAIQETGRLTDRKIELDEDALQELNRKFRFLMAHLSDRPEVSITYFRADKRKAGGACLEATGIVEKLDEPERLITMHSGLKIPMDDVLKIESDAFAPVFCRARELDVPFTCHAGDSQGPETVEDALNFGAKRIGHGHHIFEDPDLCRRAIREGVTLEICPTSNIQCQTRPSYAQHPAKKLLDMGMRITINTDNMILSGIDLDREYRHCLEEMGFTREDLIQMLHFSADAAFVSPETRAVLHSKIDESV